MLEVFINIYDSIPMVQRSENDQNNIIIIIDKFTYSFLRYLCY